MTRVIEKTLYKFDELSDDAKEKAREWWRQCEAQDSGSDLIDRDDFEQVAKILGIEFDSRRVPLMNGKTRSEPMIWFSGFSSQGDGACFDGRYSYAKGAAKTIRDYAPNDSELHRIADELQAIQRKSFYRIEARTKQNGYYRHSGCMSVDVYVNGDDAPRAIEEEIRDLLRSFADWIYRQLESEYEYRMSDENVDESIRINEYEFREDGHIA